MNRTPAYKFTFARGDSKGFAKLDRLKAKIRKENAKGNGRPKRVVLRARLGENNPAAEYYRARARAGVINAYQMIKMEHGSRFDVYVYDR